MRETKIGILLANLGSPDAPTPKAISRYLEQFLTDCRVVDLPRWKWLPLLNCVILPMRSKRLSKNYQSIWLDNISPLLHITQRQQQKLTALLRDQGMNAVVEIGMTYGQPSITSAIEKFRTQQVEKIIVLPLYPQYSSTTTAPVFDAFARALHHHRHIVPFEFIHSYHNDENYISALTESIKVRCDTDEFLLFSFHGIPQRYEQQGDYYRRHCEQTVQAIVNKLGLAEHRWRLVFQSRFGTEPWLQPYTDEFLTDAARQGIKK